MTKERVSVTYPWPSEQRWCVVELTEGVCVTSDIGAAPFKEVILAKDLTWREAYAYRYKLLDLQEALQGAESTVDVLSVTPYKAMLKEPTAQER